MFPNLNTRINKIVYEKFAEVFPVPRYEVNSRTDNNWRLRTVTTIKPKQTTSVVNTTTATQTKKNACGEHQTHALLFTSSCLGFRRE